MVKNIQVVVEDSLYENLIEKKDGRSWVKFFEDIVRKEIEE